MLKNRKNLVSISSLCSKKQQNKCKNPEPVIQRYSVKKEFLNSLQNSQEKPVLESLFNRVTRPKVLSCKFCNIFKNTFSKILLNSCF